MDEPSSIAAMTEQDRRISEIIAEGRSRLRNFIRKRVPNDADVETIGVFIRSGGDRGAGKG